MSVIWQEVRAECRADTAALDVRLRLRNDSPQAWSAASGFALDWRVSESETGTPVGWGGPVAPDAEVPPGAAFRASLAIPLPREPGSYTVTIAAPGASAWFALIEVEVNDTGTRLRRVRVTTGPRLRAGRLARSLGRAFTYPAATIWRNRALIRGMVRRDILGRYRGSFGGAFWTIINPLLLMLTYYFVFGIVLRARFGADPSRAGFALYFLAGMLPWLAFSEAAGRAPTVMLEHRSFVKKLVFAVETLPVNLVVAGLVSELFAVLLFTGGVWVARGAVPASILWLPAIVIPQMLFTAGVCWFLAALGVFVRDLGQINGFLLTLWFFLTPICYPEASLPPAAVPILDKNPVYVLVRAYRTVFLDGRAPEWIPLAKLACVSVAVFVLGHAWFYKLRKSFADLL